MLAFDNLAWEDYLYFKEKDKSISKKIDKLLKETLRDPFTGIGKPEKLKGNLSGFWSRRITEEHRIVYQVHEFYIIIIGSKYHY